MSYETTTARWVAVSNRDKAADGIFFYAVKSTGIYCRPTCAARLARRANVDFYKTRQEAEAAGFRPCKRCKPELTEREDPQEETVKRACDVIARVAREGTGQGESSSMGAQGRETKGLGLKELAEQVGKTPRYLHKIFKDRMGVTPKQYAEQMRELYAGSSTAGAGSGGASAMATGYTTPFAFDDFYLGVDLELSPELEAELAREFDPGRPEMMSDGGGMSPEGSMGNPLTPANTQFETFPAVLNDGQHTLFPKPPSRAMPENSFPQDEDDFLSFVPPMKDSDWSAMSEFVNFPASQ